LAPGAGVRLNEMVMAAPDVDIDLFQNLLAKVQPLAAGMTLYASASDWALRLARFLARKPRAGGVFENGPILAPHLDSIDVTSMAELFGLNHSTHSSNESLLNDIGRLLTKREHPPAKRSPELHAVPEQPPPVRYWKYAKKK
jgi:esterase/lipase superfamily enzyme